jgi:hypothetical protein
VARDHRGRAHQASSGHGVVAIHRVVAADAHQRHVDRVALAHQAQVGEQGGVAEVVDDLAAEADHHPRGHACGAVRGGRGVPRRDELDPDVVELDRAAEVRVGQVLDAGFPQLAGDLSDGHDLRAGALGDVHDVAVVVGVSVRQEDVRGVELIGRSRGLRVAGQERIHEDARVAVGELEAGMAQEADVHVSVSFGVVLHVEFPGELPPNRHPDEHSHAGLLGEQRLDPLGPCGLVRLGEGGAYLRAMSVAEPATLVERVRQHALQLRRQHG